MKPIEETEFFNTLTPEVHLIEDDDNWCWVIEGDMLYRTQSVYDPELETNHDAKVRLAEEMRHHILKHLGAIED